MGCKRIRLKKIIRFFLNKINFNIHVNNIIDRNIESKVMKISDNEAVFDLIAKMIGLRPTHLIIKKMSKISKITYLYNILTNMI